MNTQLIFRSGLRSIGGTIIEMINGNDRLIFDIGILFDPVNHIEQLPNVEGIFEGESNYNDYILLSHLHLDHSKAMNMVKNEIPVIMSNKSLDFYNTLLETGFDQIEGEHNNKVGVEFNETFNIGGFEVTFYPVDHDVEGASAIYIKNEDISLFYSGDLCIHGRNSKYTFNTINDLKEENIDISVFEGVSISFIEDDYKLIPSKDVEVKEDDFVDNVVKNLNNENIILFNPYIMGVQRMLSIFELSKTVNKKIVIRDYLEPIFKKYITSDYLILNKDINLNEITTDHILHFDFENRDEYTNLLQKATLLQTGGSPLGDYDPNWEILKEFCSINSIEFTPCGLGGHGAPEHIAYIANEIAATYLMPLHSFKPELLKVDNSEQLMPIQDEILQFKKHQLLNKS